MPYFNEPIKEGEGEEISTHTPRAGSDGELQRPPVRVQISTHTPRAGSDRVVGLEEVS